MSDEVDKVMEDAKRIAVLHGGTATTALAVLAIVELRRIADALEAAREDGPR